MSGEFTDYSIRNLNEKAMWFGFLQRVKESLVS